MIDPNQYWIKGDKWKLAQFWLFIAALVTCFLIGLCGCADPLFLGVVTAPAAIKSGIDGCGEDAYESYQPKK